MGLRRGAGAGSNMSATSPRSDPCRGARVPRRAQFTFVRTGVSLASRTRETTFFPFSVRILIDTDCPGARPFGTSAFLASGNVTAVPSGRRSVRLLPGSSATRVYDGAFATLTERPATPGFLCTLPAAAGAAPVSGSDRPGSSIEGGAAVRADGGAGAAMGSGAGVGGAVPSVTVRFARSSGSAGFTAVWSDGATAPAPAAVGTAVGWASAPRHATQASPNAREGDPAAHQFVGGWALLNFDGGGVFGGFGRSTRSAVFPSNGFWSGTFTTTLSPAFEPLGHDRLLGHLHGALGAVRLDERDGGLVLVDRLQGPAQREIRRADDRLAFRARGGRFGHGDGRRGAAGAAAGAGAAVGAAAGGLIGGGVAVERPVTR